MLGHLRVAARRHAAPAPSPARAAALFILLALLPIAAGAEEPMSDAERAQLRVLDPSSRDYRTPRAGEGFKTSIFGRDVEVAPRDRRSTTAWDIGIAAWIPWPDAAAIRPFGSIYLWRRPDENSFLRGTLVLLYDDVIYAHSLAKDSPFEVVLNFENNTIPFDRSEYADGERLDDEEMTWGWVRGGVGLGWRRQVESGFSMPRLREGVDPQAPDNQISFSATFEPKYLFFKEGKDVPSTFTSPESGVELGGRLQFKWDAMERNLLDLVHHGVSASADATQGYRPNWEDWGIDEREQAGDGKYPRLLQGHLVAAGGVPGLNERHRLIGSVHAGVGGNLDRFSAPRLGGGPGGDEFGALARPLIPGAALQEYFPDHYAVAIAEYRYELFFFTYLSARASHSWLDRDRLSAGRVVHRENDELTSVGARVTTGFLFSTRLQLDYNYNFDVIRDNDDRGGNEIVLHVSRSF